MLKGIDVSSYKDDLDLHKISYDFVIAKATGGTGYIDRTCDHFVQTAIAMHKKWGVFHYRGDGFGFADPHVEASFFIKHCKGYIGKGVLVLDWERGGNPNVADVGWAKAWLDYVYAMTGVRPWIYMPLNVLQSYDWSPVIKAGYALWLAAYVKDGVKPVVVPNYAMDTKLDPNPKWDGIVGDVAWQFTSTGRLTGYGGNLDCDFFYGSAAAWDAYAAVKKPVTPPGNGGNSETTTKAALTTTTTMGATTTATPNPLPTQTTTTTLESDSSSTTTTTTGIPASPKVPVIKPAQAQDPIVWLVTFIIKAIKALFNKKG